jgi:hypothetical protein
MGLQGKDEAELAELENQLLGRLRDTGGTSGNVSLRRGLDWSEDLYWPIRNRLYDRGLVRLGRGHGGSVTIVERPAEVATADAAATSSLPDKELNLYAPMAEVLRTDWVKDYRLRQSLVEITATQGRRQTGGTWTRPDLVVAGIRVFPHLPGKYFDLFTFEVKPHWAINVTAVYEALAHRRAATHSYVWLHVPLEKKDGMASAIDVIASEAKRFGVGLVVVTDPTKYETWDEKVEAVRTEPDPEALNDFITVQLSAAAKEEIVAWVR